MPVKRNIDFFEQIRADSAINSRPEKRPSKLLNKRPNSLPNKRIPLVMPFCVAILLVLISWGVFSWLSFNAGQRLSVVGAALSGVTEPDGTSNGLGDSGIGNMLQIELEYRDSNRLTHSRLKEVFALQPDDLSVLGVTYSDNLIVIDGWSVRELCGADFAKLLRDRPDAFYGVNYDGVTASGGGYRFTVSFNCAGEIY